MQVGQRLRACHLAAWYVAQRSQSPSEAGVSPERALRTKAIIALAWLKVLGMTRVGYNLVRAWQFAYYMYDEADDNIKKKAQALFDHSPRDAALLRTYLFLVDLYRRDRFIILNANAARAQTLALRQSALLLEPYSATPPAAGRIPYCNGCRTWAFVVEKPAVDAAALESRHQALARRRDADYADKVRQMRAMAPGRALPQDVMQTLAYGVMRVRRTAPAIADPTGGEDGDDDVAKPAVEHQQQKRTGVGAALSLRGAYINPLNWKLYCRRGYRHTGTSGRPPRDVNDDDDSASTASSDDDDDDDDEDESDNDADVDATNVHQLAARYARLVAQPPGPGGATAPAHAQQGKGVDIASVLLERSQWCKEELWRADMLGTGKQLHNHSYVLCCICARPTEVSNAHVINGGKYSCGMHPLLAEYGNMATLWRLLDTPPDMVARAALVATGTQQHQSAARCAGPCFVCLRRDTALQVWVYDHAAKLFQVPLCVMHRQLVQHRLLPLQENQLRLRAPPPIRIDVLLKHAQ